MKEKLYKIENKNKVVFYKSLYRAGSAGNYYDAMQAMGRLEKNETLANFKYGVKSVALATKSEIKKLERDEI